MNPQPVTAKVLTKLLSWIDDMDMASQDLRPEPAPWNEAFTDMFQADSDWWATEMSKRVSSKAEEEVPAEPDKVEDRALRDPRSTFDRVERSIEPLGIPDRLSIESSDRSSPKESPIDCRSSRAIDRVLRNPRSIKSIKP